MIQDTIGTNSATGHPLRVLITESSKTTRYLLNRILDNSGFTVVGEADSGEEALQIFKTSKIRPDILITNIELSGMNGLELINSVVSDYPETRVMVMTQNKATLEKFLLVDYYIDSVIQKPITSADFVNELTHISNAYKNLSGFNYELKKSKNAIIVDDSAVCRYYLGRSMKREKFNLLFVSESAEEGIERFKSLDQSIDFICTDIDMPGMDGLEMISQLKSLRSDLEFIVFTSLRSQNIIDRLKELKVKTLIYKPYNFNDIKKLFLNEESKNIVRMLG